MKRPGGGLIPDTPPVTILFVFGAKDHFTDLAPVQGARAHQAGFHGNIQCCFGKIFAPEMIESGSQRYDLGMRSAVRKSFGLVVSPGNDTSAHDDNGANGDLVLLISQPCLLQCLLHKIFVVHRMQDHEILPKFRYERACLVQRPRTAAPLLSIRGNAPLSVATPTIAVAASGYTGR